MTDRTHCRRNHDRLTLPKSMDARVEFAFPRPGGHPCAMRLRDISAGGLSFVLANDLPGLDMGSTIEHATLVVGSEQVAIDLLVVHLTPDDRSGATCGALVFPRGDVHVHRYTMLVERLDEGITRPDDGTHA